MQRAGLVDNASGGEIHQVHFCLMHDQDSYVCEGACDPAEPEPVDLVNRWPSERPQVEPWICFCAGLKDEGTEVFTSTI